MGFVGMVLSDGEGGGESLPTAGGSAEGECFLIGVEGVFLSVSEVLLIVVAEKDPPVWGIGLEFECFEDGGFGLFSEFGEGGGLRFEAEGFDALGFGPVGDGDVEESVGGFFPFSAGEKVFGLGEGIFWGGECEDGEECEGTG